MRGEASPDHFAGDTKLIEHLRRVLPDSTPQYFAFPRSGRNLVTLKLFDDVKRSVQPMQLRSSFQVLPVEEEPHEIGRGDRLDFPPQAAQGQSMDSRQHPAIAPFDFGLR